ncbi:MAG: hypothetical protein ABI882_20885 [Acidobacteriota bacterium]
MSSRKLMSQLALLVMSVWMSSFAFVPITSARTQTVRNPKLAPADLETARSTTKESGGAEAELVYSARIDGVTKGTFDSLVVVYGKGSGPAREFYAAVIRDGKKYALAGEKSGRALPTGDRFLRIGLRHEGDKAPLLRLMSAIGESGSADERQRNLDFQFDGKEFQLVGQSTATPAR